MDSEDLKELNDIFNDMGGVDKIEDYTSNYERLPDGDYIGEIEKIESKNSKNSGKPMLEVVIAVEEGKKEYTHLMLAGSDIKATKTAIARTVSQLKKLGVEGTELKDFLAGAEKLTGTRVKMSIRTTVTKSTGKEFRNVNLELA